MQGWRRNRRPDIHADWGTRRLAKIVVASRLIVAAVSLCWLGLQLFLASVA